MIWNIWECNIWLCDWVRSVGQQMIDSLRPSGKTQIIHIHAGNTEGIKLIVLNFPALWHENIVRIDFKTSLYNLTRLEKERRRWSLLHKSHLFSLQKNSTLTRSPSIPPRWMLVVRGARTNWAVADARGFQSIPQHCTAPDPDQTGKNVRANLSPVKLFSITQH